jgi:hypothetical protein
MDTTFPHFKTIKYRQPYRQTLFHAGVLFEDQRQHRALKKAWSLYFVLLVHSNRDDVPAMQPGRRCRLAPG